MGNFTARTISLFTVLLLLGVSTNSEAWPFGGRRRGGGGFIGGGACVNCNPQFQGGVEVLESNGQPVPFETQSQPIPQPPQNNIAGVPSGTSTIPTTNALPARNTKPPEPAKPQPPALSHGGNQAAPGSTGTFSAQPSQQTRPQVSYEEPVARVGAKVPAPEETTDDDFEPVKAEESEKPEPTKQFTVDFGDDETKTCAFTPIGKKEDSSDKTKCTVALATTSDCLVSDNEGSAKTFKLGDLGEFAASDVLVLSERDMTERTDRLSRNRAMLEVKVACSKMDDDQVQALGTANEDGKFEFTPDTEVKASGAWTKTRHGFDPKSGFPCMKGGEGSVASDGAGVGVLQKNPDGTQALVGVAHPRGRSDLICFDTGFLGWAKKELTALGYTLKKPVAIKAIAKTPAKATAPTGASAARTPANISYQDGGVLNADTESGVVPNLNYWEAILGDILNPATKADAPTAPRVESNLAVAPAPYTFRDLAASAKVGEAVNAGVGGPVTAGWTPVEPQPVGEVRQVGTREELRQIMWSNKTKASSPITTRVFVKVPHCASCTSQLPRFQAEARASKDPNVRYYVIEETRENAGRDLFGKTKPDGKVSYPMILDF